MVKIAGLNQIKAPLKGSVITIGNFDGLHLGHQALMSRVVEKSKMHPNLKSVVFTFDQHPSQFLRPNEVVSRLSSPAQLEGKIKALGIDVLIVQEFDQSFSSLSAESFIRDFLYPKLNPQAFVVGYDFAFGHGREGNFQLLKKIGSDLHFEVEQLPEVKIDGQVISSSAIRKFVSAGEIKKANEYLGRPYMIEGVKEVGDGRGIKLGFPTWNLKPEIETLLGAGVYITQFEISGKLYPAVTNVGFRPTFYSILKKNIETHVLTPFSDQSPSARIHFINKIRDEKKFSAVEDLIEQIHTDIDSAKAFFNLPDKG